MLSLKIIHIVEMALEQNDEFHLRTRVCSRFSFGKNRIVCEFQHKIHFEKLLPLVHCFSRSQDRIPYAQGKLSIRGAGAR